MLQWFIRFPEFVEFTEFLFHLGKTPLFLITRSNQHIPVYFTELFCHCLCLWNILFTFTKWTCCVSYISTGNSRRHSVYARTSTKSTEPTKLSVQEGESWSWSQKKILTTNNNMSSSSTEDRWWISMQLTSEVVGVFFAQSLSLWFSPFAEHSLQFTDTLSHIAVVVVRCVGFEVGGTHGGGDAVSDELRPAFHHVSDGLFRGVLVLFVRRGTRALRRLRALQTFQMFNLFLLGYLDWRLIIMNAISWEQN